VSEQRGPHVAALGDGRVVIERDGSRTIAYAAADGPHTWVFLDGRTFVVDVRSSRRGSTHQRDDEAALSSPMPAMVLSVNVEVGQAVSEGDLLVRLEAMKMELPIRAPRDARVKGIACREGELVQPGIPLLELE
jgi:biotin carboxyl carrier protein